MLCIFTCNTSNHDIVPGINAAAYSSIGFVLMVLYGVVAIYTYTGER